MPMMVVAVRARLSLVIVVSFLLFLVAGAVDVVDWVFFVVAMIVSF